jgi:pimeloyl-ACP methyl ester carboxylesterase
MRYLVTGPEDGPKILLLHGLVIMVDYFEPLMRELAQQGYRVYAPELPGTGYSPRIKKALTVAEMTDIYAWWTQHLELTQPMHVVGHSAGGQVAIDFALRYPQQVETLTLMAAAGGKSVTGWLREMLGVFSDIVLENPPMIWHATYSYLRAGLLETLAAAQTHIHFEARDMARLLSEKPTLIIWGTRDIISPVRLGRDLYRIIRNSRLKLIKGGTHALLLGYHREIHACLIEFLDEYNAGYINNITLDKSVMLEERGLDSSINEVIPEIIYQRTQPSVTRRAVRRFGLATMLTPARKVKEVLYKWE